MNLNPTNQLSLYNHYFELTNFINLYKNQILPNKILLSGEKGIGKSTLAYHIINYVLSIDEEHSYDIKNFKVNPENKSFKLILNKSNPNFISIDIENDKKSIDINQIRNLILLLLINIKYILSFGSSRIFNKALIELIFKSSILSISTNLGFLLNEDLFNDKIKFLI